MKTYKRNQRSAAQSVLEFVKGFNAIVTFIITIAAVIAYCFESTNILFLWINYILDLIPVFTYISPLFNGICISLGMGLLC